MENGNVQFKSENRYFPDFRSNIFRNFMNRHGMAWKLKTIGYGFFSHRKYQAKLLEKKTFAKNWQNYFLNNNINLVRVQI
jgi:hypothetical protein